MSYPRTNYQVVDTGAADTGRGLSGQLWQDALTGFGGNSPDLGRFEIEDFDDLVKERPMVYQDTVSDDTVAIYYRIRSWGFIDKIDLSYAVKNRYYIKEKEVIKIEVTNTKEKKFNGFYFGLNAGTRLDTVGIHSFTPMLEASFRNINIEAGYDLVDGSIEFGIKKRISFRKKLKPTAVELP